MADRIDTTLIPQRKLYTGEEIPCMGLGTFGSDKYNADQVSEAVYGAIRYGYRLIDCAAVYQNEAQIGDVLQRVMREGIALRKELFIQICGPLILKLGNGTRLRKVECLLVLVLGFPCVFIREGLCYLVVLWI